MRAVPDSNLLRQDIYQLDIAINKTQKQRLNHLLDKISNIYSMLKLNAPSKKVKSFHREFKVNLYLMKNLILKTLKTFQLSLDNKNIQKKQAHQMIKSRALTHSKNIEIDLKAIERNIFNKFSQLNELIKLKVKQIDQSNPKIILKKGYAIIRDNQDAIVKNSKVAKKNEHLKIEMVDGYVDVYRKEKKT